jgi:hypothetical protein
MAAPRRVSDLAIKEEELAELEIISRSRTEPAGRVCRAPVVEQEIEAGETADVVLVQPDFAEELTKSGKVSAGDRPMIGRVGIGLGGAQ